MANEVKIKVTADTNQAKTALGQLNKTWVGLNSGIELAQKAAQFLGEAYNALVGDTQEYAQAVLKMTRVSGQSAEVTSRLIELTDDFGIAQETLAVAMRSATTKGIAFTTDNLASLSDQYLALPPGIQQAQFAAETFGARAGPEMQKLLEKGSKAIRDQAASIDEHMLMTEEDLQASEEWRIAQDNLNDSVTAVSRTIGKVLIPNLVKAADAYVLLASWNEKLDAAIEQNGQSLVDAKVPYKQYIETQVEVAKQAGYIVDAQNGLIRVYRLTANGSVEVANTLGILTRTEYEAAKSSESLVTGSMHVTEQMQFLQTYGPGAAAAIYGVGDAAADAAAKLRDELTGAFEDAQTASQNWSKSAGDDIISQLDAAELKAGDFEQALIAVDSKMGTSEYNTRLQKEATQKLVDQYKRTGDIDAFRDGLDRLKNGGFIPLQESAVLARVRIQELYEELRKIDGQTATAYVNVITGSGGSTMTGNYGKGSDYNPANLPGFGGLAAGGPAYAGSMYPVGENGPEPFIPSRNGYVMGRADAMNQMRGGDTINIYLNGTPAQGMSDMRQLAGQVATEYRRARGGR